MTTTNLKYVQAQTFTQSGSGVSIGGTTMTLDDFNQIDGTPLSMSNFGIIGYGTCEPGSGVNEEQISFTGIVNNVDGTTTLTGISTVLDIFPYTETSGFLSDHAGGTSFVISNTAGFYGNFANKLNDETITGKWFVIDPTLPTQIVNKEYVDGIVVAGGIPATPTVPGIAMVANSTDIATSNDSRTFMAVSYPVFVLPSQLSAAVVPATVLSTPLVAGQNISVGQTVYPGPYQATPITFDNQVSGSAVGSTSSPITVTQSFTMGSGANRILLLCLETLNSNGTNSDAVISNVQYAGDAMTLLAGPGPSSGQIWYLVNPQSGTHNITFTSTPSNGGPYGFISAYTAKSYYNVSGSVPTCVTTTSGTASVTTTETCVIAQFCTSINSGASPTASSNSLTQNLSTNTVAWGGGGFLTIITGNSVQVNTATTYSIVTTHSFTIDKIFSVVLAPEVVPIDGEALLTSTQNFPTSPDAYKKFIGFATNTVTTGQIVNVQFGGVVSGLTSLTIDAIYYLGDTPGSISTSPGTNTKFAGIALSATTLLILNALS